MVSLIVHAVEECGVAQGSGLPARISLRQSVRLSEVTYEISPFNEATADENEEEDEEVGVGAEDHGMMFSE